MSYSHNCLFIGKVLIKKDLIDSSNNYAKQLLSNSKPIEGTAILTDFQSEGRGQRDNVWQSNPSENLTLSIILYPNVKAEKYFLLNEMISIGLRDAIVNFLPDADVQIKWPNDILVNKKKIAGILIENNISNGVIISSVIGIGLNVNQEAFKSNIDATSLKLVLKRAVELDKVIESLFSSIEHAYLISKRDPAFIKSAYWQYLYGHQQPIEVRHIDTDILLKGHINAVGEDGIIDFITTKDQHYFFNFKEIKFLLN